MDAAPKGAAKKTIKGRFFSTTAASSVDFLCFFHFTLVATQVRVGVNFSSIVTFIF